MKVKPAKYNQYNPYNLLCLKSKLQGQVFTHSSGTCMRETHHEELCKISLHKGPRLTHCVSFMKRNFTHFLMMCLPHASARRMCKHLTIEL